MLRGVLSHEHESHMMIQCLDDVDGVVLGCIEESSRRKDPKVQRIRWAERTSASHLQHNDVWNLLAVSEERKGFRP
jgi:hypothetical protein